MNVKGELQEVSVMINMEEENVREVEVGKSHQCYYDNSIKTLKYTLLNFAPVSIREQFRRQGNIYLSILMIIGYCGYYFDSAVNPTSTVVPLLIVVTFRMAQEEMSDISQYKSNKQTNQHPYSVLRRVTEYDEGITSIMDGKVVELELEEKECGKNEEVEGLAQNLAKVSFQQTECANIYLGDILIVKNRQVVPADMTLLESSSEKGSAYT